MFREISVIATFSFFILTGCATQSGWSPTVDPYGDPNPASINSDKVDCRQLALEASGGTANQTAKGALAGGAIGAVVGTILGAATGGDIGESAATGAAIGGTAGGISEGMNAEEQYKRAFINCMRNRRHNVIN